MRERYVKIEQEKEEQRIKFESIHLDLQVQISSHSDSQMFNEEKTNSLQRETDTRTLVLEEEKIYLKGIVRELETSVDSLNKDLESSMVMEQEKHAQIVDLQDHVSSLAGAKMFLEEEMKPFHSEMDRRTLIL